MSTKVSFGTILRQRHKIPEKIPETRLSQSHKIIEEQCNQFENLQYISLLFYLPIILMLLYFWI